MGPRKRRRESEPLSAGLPSFVTIGPMLFGMTRTRTYDALSRGLIKGKKLGGRTLVNVTSGLAYIEGLPDYPAAQRAKTTICAH
jgi:hypothetical protein